MAYLITMGIIQQNIVDEDKCNVLCNCSINNSCPYTFDYDDVKDCDCTLGGE